MTRTAEGWRMVVSRYRAQADACEDRAARYDALSRHASTREDTLVSDTYAEAGYRAQADADWWRDRAARAEAYAVDAELPSTLSVVRDAGFVSAETAVITVLWAGGLLFATACALVGLG